MTPICKRVLERTNPLFHVLDDTIWTGRSDHCDQMKERAVEEMKYLKGRQRYRKGIRCVWPVTLVGREGQP